MAKVFIIKWSHYLILVARPFYESAGHGLTIKFKTHSAKHMTVTQLKRVKFKSGNDLSAIITKVWAKTNA